jgi:hypothetical protein
MADQEGEQFNNIFDIIKKKFETENQFQFRKSIYDEVFNDTKDKKKALIYSNIWVNILSMECDYPKEVMEQVMKYKPKTNIYKV